MGLDRGVRGPGEKGHDHDGQLEGVDEDGFRCGGPAAHGCCSGAALAAGGNGNGNANGADNGNGNGGSNAQANGGTGHTPVTVCHRLGNGGYHVLTMDDSALKAHLGHGDLYPVPADGCPPAPAAPAKAPAKTPAKNPGKTGGPHREEPRPARATPARRTGTRR